MIFIPRFYKNWVKVIMGPCKGYIYTFSQKESDDTRHVRHVSLTSLPVYIYIYIFFFNSKVVLKSICRQTKQEKKLTKSHNSNIVKPTCKNQILSE